MIYNSLVSHLNNGIHLTRNFIRNCTHKLERYRYLIFSTTDDLTGNLTLADEDGSCNWCQRAGPIIYECSIILQLSSTTNEEPSNLRRINKATNTIVEATAVL